MTFERLLICILLAALLAVLGVLLYTTSEAHSPLTLDPNIQLCRMVKP